MSPLNPQKSSTPLADRFTEKFANAHDFAFLKILTEKFPNAELYLVGGMVRDVVMGLPGSKDYDFVLRHVPAEALIKALKHLGFVDLVGRTFGVIKFMPRNSSLTEAIDIALPRTEQAAGTGAYRDVTTQSDPALPIETDLSRRDLTINAMAWDIHQQQLLDPFNGLQDIENKLIRCVGAPHERFQEDYSRMLRAIRFACKLDFAIADETWQAMRELMPHLADERTGTNGKTDRVVPMEIILREISKAFSAMPLKAFDLFDQSRAWEVLFPDLVPVTRDNAAWEMIREQIALSEDLTNNTSSAQHDPMVLFSVLALSFPRNERSVRAQSTFLRTWSHQFRLTKEQTDFIAALPEAIHAATQRPSLVTLEHLFFQPLGSLLLHLLEIRAITPAAQADITPYRTLLTLLQPLQERAKKNNGQLPAELLDGTTIMKLLNVTTGGKIIFEIKKDLREEQLTGKLQTAKEATQWVILHRERYQAYS